MEADLDLEVKATSVWDYINENKRAKDIFVWAWGSFLSPNGKKICGWMVFLVFVSGLMGVLKAYSVKMMIDGLSSIVGGNNDRSTLIYGFISMALLVIGGRTIGFFKNYLQEYFLADFLRGLSGKVSFRFFEKPLGLHVSENTILNADNVKKGYDRVYDLVQNIVIELPDLIFQVMLPFIMLWPIDHTVALMMALVMITHLLLSGYLNYRAMVEGYPIEKMWRSLYRYRVERWRHIERVKNNAKEQDELDSMDRRYQEASSLDLKLWISYIIWSFGRGFICAIFTLLAILYGLYEISMGKLSLGFIYPLVALSIQILDNLWQIGSIERKIHYNLHSVGILKEALAIPSNLAVKDNPIVLSKASPCRVEFDSVSYGFRNKDGDPQVLNNISFTIEPDEKVALIGTSGAGKSTLMKLLLHYMDPISGAIRIDGVDLRDIKSDSWLDLVGYIPQQAQILNGTIKYNALYGVQSSELKNISDDYIWQQMRMLQVDFGDRLTDGLETRLGYNGIELSGGQNQRLMILAAAMKNPRFMIIDEATSSLDSSTEKLVQFGLEKVLSRNCSALIVAHRLSSVRRICNKFVVIEPNGHGSRVAGIGRSFEELYESCSQFRKLAQDQEIKI